jgi:phage-related protein
MKVSVYDKKTEKFILSLEERTQSRALQSLTLLQDLARELAMPHSKYLGRELFELRINSLQNVRLLYIFHKDQILILHGFIKQSNKIPTKELRVALNRKKLVESI